MAFKINFFDNVGLYYADDLNKQFQSIIKTNGVADTTSLQIKPTVPASLNVTITKGSAWMDGHFVTSDTDITLEIPISSSSSALNSIYLILDLLNKSAFVEITNAEPEVNKVKLKLGSVEMTNMNTKVESNQITNTASVVSLVRQSEVDVISESLRQLITGADNQKVALANYATTAGSAGYAETAYNATNATNSTNATNATNSTYLIVSTNNTTNYTCRFVYLTQSQYNAISNKDKDVIYFVY